MIIHVSKHFEKRIRCRHGDSGHAGVVTDVHCIMIVTIEGNTSAGPTGRSPAAASGRRDLWAHVFTGLTHDLVTQGFLSVKSILKIAA